jgi:hypothetical protein
MCYFCVCFAHLDAAAVDQLTASNHVLKHHPCLLALVDADGVALALHLQQHIIDCTVDHTTTQHQQTTMLDSSVTLPQSPPALSASPAAAQWWPPANTQQPQKMA